MIKDRKPLNIIETEDYARKYNSESPLLQFIKKFSKLDIEEANEMKKEIENLKFSKINAEQIVKIIDLMPENGEELNKIFTSVNLDENESKNIFEIVKKFK